MPLELRSNPAFFASRRAVWLQWVVVGVFALSWWRGENLIADLARQGENVADAALAARKAATAVQASLGLATVEVIVGANDELLFDGQSWVIAADGAVVHQGPCFAPSLDVVDLDGRVEPRFAPVVEQHRRALVRGIRSGNQIHVDLRFPCDLPTPLTTVEAVA